MRYSRQGYEIPIELDGVELGALDLAALERRFGEAHSRLYGFVLEGRRRSNLRVVATGRVPLPSSRCGRTADTTRRPRRRGRRGLDAGGDDRRPDVRARAALEPGISTMAAAIVEQYDATVVLPGHRAVVDPWMNLLIGPERRADDHAIDVATLDLIENALLNARFEMDEVVRRAAMSPTIRVQHDEFPMICNADGQMVVGQFGSYIPEVIDRFGGDIARGGRDPAERPVLCKGSISHCNDWLVILPVFFDGRHVAFASLFGHMMDVGGRCRQPGLGRPLDLGGGIRIPPIKIFDRGVLNETALEVILNNTPHAGHEPSDLMAIIGGCRAAERRIVEICERFGPETFEARAMRCSSGRGGRWRTSSASTSRRSRRSPTGSTTTASATGPSRWC